MASVTSKLLLSAAIKRGWKAELLDEQHAPVIAITGPDDKTHYLYSCVSGTSSAAGFAINQNKLATYLVAQRLHIPIAHYCMISSNERQLHDFCQQEWTAGHELVVKPIDRDHANGVSVGIQNQGQLQQAVAYARAFSDKIMVQRRYHGKEFRVTVVDGRFIAAVWRTPPIIAGDGVHTVRELLTQENARRSSDKHALDRTLHVPVADVERYLGGQKMAAVLKNGQELMLLGTANAGRGGEVIDITERLHDSYKRAVEKLCTTLQLGVCGADFLGDFTKPLEDSKGILLETNCAIGLRTHHYPNRGKPRDVAGAILDAFGRQHGYINSDKVLSN